MGDGWRGWARRTREAGLALCVFAAAPALGASMGAVAAPQDDILKYLVNSPDVGAWQVRGLAKPVKPQRAEGVPGERAIRVVVKKATDNPWDIAAVSPIDKPIRKGDRVLFAFWARAVEFPASRAGGWFAGVRIEETAPPYGAIGQRAADIGRDWTMIEVSGIATRDYAPGEAAATVHLGGLAQTIELGPAFVLDTGPPPADE